MATLPESSRKATYPHILELSQTSISDYTYVFQCHFNPQRISIFPFTHLSERRTNLFHPAWQKSRPVQPVLDWLFSHQSLKKTLFQISAWNPDWVPNLGCREMAPDFPLELSQLFLSFASSMDIAMQEDDTITQYARAFTSDNFTMS
ncbi:hypothetical protein AVEN_28210-1 [Araneus ventricosus]|uniref:Uncharacterized protein n=1 Tax=Araneus ventricosus TaxID=182803 RepID=A0A4Y2EXG4_ARAVE|nr:hypothetical protein AVEN_28210-1 [Araneus ventricosus]